MQVKTTVDSKEAKYLNHNLYRKETNLEGNLSASPPANKHHVSQENHVKFQKIDFSKLSTLQVDF